MAANSVYMLDRYYRRKHEAIEALGGECVKCGSIDDLQFHHIDPESKSFTIGSRLSSVSEVKLRLELEKCELLCGSCHREHHSVDYHGTYYGYKGKKCRCTPCRDAHRLYNRQRNQRLRS